MDKTLVTVAIIAAFPPTLVGLLSLRRSKQNANAIQEVHLSINSRMDQLLKSTKGEATAQGREEGREEGRAENKN